ncbi:tetratricopeptide repeat protein [Methyloversatilis sp.]|uniref:tetratricopeptide repeat protein n=1 Tax=Methyloversatilis sp. TaxID=2569862 RepID=UPI003F6F0490
MKNKPTPSRQPSPAELQPVFAAYNGGRLADAASAAQQLLRRYPAAIVLHSVRGSALAGLGRLDDAEQAFREAVAADPRSAELLSNLGLVQQQRGRNEQALATYRRAFALKPDFPELLYNMGVVQDALGHSDDAAASYRRALKLQPRFAVAWFNLGTVCERLQRTDDALAAYREAVAVEPGFVEAHANLGAALQKQGRHDEAVAAYRKALAIQPTATAWFSLGTAQRDQGLLGDAAASYRQALALAPGYADAHSNLGEILRDQGDAAATIAAFRAALAIDPAHGEANYNLGLLHYDMGELAEAMPYFERAQIRDWQERVLYCLYKTRRFDVFRARLADLIGARLPEDRHPEDRHPAPPRRAVRHNSPMLATLSAHHAANFRVADDYTFCPAPLDFVFHSHIDALSDASDALLADLLRDVTHAEIEARKQGRLHHGIQSAGNLFRRSEPSFARLAALIGEQVARCRARLTGETCVFAQDFPPDTVFSSAWYVKMSKGGHLTSHIHETGWLSGVVYLAIPRDRPAGSLAGGIEFSTDGDDYPREHDDFPRKTLLPVAGDIVLFPSSLFHRTIPFESNEERICIAFDVKPGRVAQTAG